jgi:hypothetical protein
MAAERPPDEPDGHPSGLVTLWVPANDPPS